MNKFVLVPGQLRLTDAEACLRHAAALKLADGWETAVAAGRQAVQSILEQDQTVYGVNTGFGLMARERISAADLQQLQVNLVLSHAAGTGAPLDDEVVRLVLLLKINSLARGFSGIRPRVVEYLIEFFNHDLLPCIPSQGSVGASGDLAPLAHLSCALLGLGDVRLDGQEFAASSALKKIGLAPLELQPKEGLALLNGTQVSTALAIAGLLGARRALAAALVAGAMSVDATLGSDTPFDDRIHALRLHPGQRDCAATLRHLLQGSAIRQSHAQCDRVQDPYSLRCQPQVLGACLDQMRFVAEVLQREANAVSDNPLVFPEDGAVLSGGNFHAEPVALAADALAVAIAEIGSLSERRIALLMDENLSALPSFLVRHGGLNSGFMIPQVTAAALCSENKSLAHPASVDSIPTSANQEDHVSMATFAARRLGDMVNNTTGIVAVELLAAAQGLDFRAPLPSSDALNRARDRIRERVEPYDHDRYFAADLQQARELIDSGHFLEAEYAIPEILAP